MPLLIAINIVMRMEQKESPQTSALSNQPSAVSSQPKNKEEKNPQSSEKDKRMLSSFR